MGKIDQITNGLDAATARSRINEAVKSGDVQTSDFAATAFIDDDSFASATSTSVASSESIKAYVDNAIQTRPVTRSFSYGKSPTGDHWIAGYYNFPTTDANLTNASPTQILGSANASYAAHAVIVASGAGTTDGSDLVLTVTGTSIDDSGNRVGSDSEVIVADCTTSSTNQMYETVKKWLGQVTFTLSSTGGSTFSYDFNYGYAKYEDFRNQDFTVTEFEVVGDSNSSDSGFDITFYLHSSDGWTYAATGFDPGGTIICQLSTDHGADDNIVAGEYFAYKRADLSVDVNGEGLEGVLVKITQTVNNAVEHMDGHIGANLAAGTIT